MLGLTLVCLLGIFCVTGRCFKPQLGRMVEAGRHFRWDEKLRRTMVPRSTEISFMHLLGFGISIPNVSRKAGNEIARNVGMPSGFTPAHQFGERELVISDLAEASIVTLEHQRQRLWRFIVEGYLRWIGKRRLMRPQNESLRFDFSSPFADVHEVEIRGHRVRPMIIEEGIGEHFYFRPRQHPELVERRFALLSDRIQSAQPDTASPYSEDRNQKRGKILPEPIVPALRIGSGISSLWGWGWLARRSGSGKYSAWSWRFLSLVLIVFGFFVLTIPGGW
jgi:hypothetical protein